MKIVTTSVALMVCFFLQSNWSFADGTVHSFERQELSDRYFSEGASVGDIDGDGHADIVSGPFWYAGPGFTTRHEIYEPVPQNRKGYANNFFSWVWDFNGDDANDILVVGFPGTPAYVYENPGAAENGTASSQPKHWVKHEVFDWVSNESPQFVQIVGDERPELVCTRDGFFGFVTIDWSQPWDRWTFTPVSEQVTATKFGHGLGVGDVNGDGRQDIIHSKGWYEQPASKATTSRWRSHSVSFSTAYGGAEMYAYDVDGDGDNDVLTSDAAHDFGLSWYEQTGSDPEPSFQHHQVMGSHPSDNAYGVVFSELHSLCLADIDGDGLKDLVTGKTYYSHHEQSPMWDAGAVVYWFKLSRTESGVQWIPYRADSDAGIGRQIVVTDINADGQMDIVTGGMKGTNVLRHSSAVVPDQEWAAAQPQPFVGQPRPVEVTDAQSLRGPDSPIDLATGRVPAAIEGETLKPTVSAGKARSQPMGGFSTDRWSGKSQLWWTGAGPAETLEMLVTADQASMGLEIVMTCAVDYAIVQVTLDDVAVGDPIDCYSTAVETTGVLKFDDLEIPAGKHRVGINVLGANPKAKKSYMVGIDYLRFVSNDAPHPVPAGGVKPTGADGKTLNMDFETGTLADWTATGTAFDGQPVSGDRVSARRSDMRSRHNGQFWIGGYEIHGDDVAKGTLTSASFRVTQPYASFRIGGGKHKTTAVQLVHADTGKVVYQVSGTNHEQLRTVAIDLRAHAGKMLKVRIVDEHAGGWGHVNFDHFRLHARRPKAAPMPVSDLVADEYPHSGLAAEAAAGAMQLPKGFRVTVGASEPDVKQPIAMALDDRGRVWIAEAYEYPIRAKGDAGRDRILVFEDSNGDGSLDKRTVFAEGLNLVSGLEVGFGGVWVGAAPYLMFIPDADRDDVPDGPPQIMLDGWGYQDTHEMLNTFTWGPDGWLYGCHGVFTHSKVGAPGTPDDQRVAINAGVWRYHPTRHDFEVFAHGTSNPWGVDFNDHGQAFVTACVIPHLFHIIQDARYQRQAGQHFNPNTYGDIVTIADHLHYLGATPHAGNSKSDEAGGGHAHSGAMIYLGDRWPAEYRDALLMNNIHGQRLNMDLLNPSGSGYVGSHGPDFLKTGDQASQILNMRYGPDGNVWMIDWYDMQACHRRDATVHDRSNGRIYKISYGDDETAAVDLQELTNLELANNATNPNEWYVRHSRRLLQERHAAGVSLTDARDRLAEIAKTAADDRHVLRAMWGLHVTGGLAAAAQSAAAESGGESGNGSGLARLLITHSSPYVRAWTIQLMMEQSGSFTSDRMQTAADLLTRIARDDDSAVTRLYVASAVNRVPVEMRWDVVSALCTHAVDSDDHNLPLMIWYAAEPLAQLDPRRALALALQAGETMPLVQEYMLRRIGSDGAGDSLEVLVAGLGQAKTAKLQLVYLSALRRATAGQRRVTAPENWTSVAKSIVAQADSQVRIQSAALGVVFGDAQATDSLRLMIGDSSVKPDDQKFALEALIAAGDPGLAHQLHELVSASGPLRATAIEGLGQFAAPETTRVLLDAYAKLSQTEKRLALGTLCSRADSGLSLLAAVEAKHIQSSDLTADLVRRLQYLKNADIDRLLTVVWGSVRDSSTDKLALIAKYRKLVEADGPSPDPTLGRTVFSRTCQTCHKLYGVGFKIGPDLTGSNRSNLDYLLSNIVDPSAVMAKEYQPTVVLTVDGRVVIGLLREDNAKSVTLQTADSLVTIPHDEIEESHLARTSMMPDDQLRAYSQHELRSLFAYLRGKKQVPIKATPETAATLFNGSDLTGWSGTEGLWSVVDGQIVGKSTGLKRNEWLVSELDAGDFHLMFDVKLVDNQGNSGVQFRSHGDPTHMTGYQADIGIGWWGKLYEEHGRGLLSKTSGEDYVKSGQWNSYEIHAIGDTVVTRINGQECVNLHDHAGASSGVIALQLHSGGPTEVRFKNLKLTVVDPDQKPVATE